MNTILQYELNKKDFINDLLQHKEIQDIDLFLNPHNICEEDIYHLENNLYILLYYHYYIIYLYHFFYYL